MKEDDDMNTTTSNTDRSTASGIHRGVWIGGGLMALTIIALATTLVVRNNDALPDTADAAATPLVATNATTEPSSANAPRRWPRQRRRSTSRRVRPTTRHRRSTMRRPATTSRNASPLRPSATPAA